MGSNRLEQSHAPKIREMFMLIMNYAAFNIQNLNLSMKQNIHFALPEESERLYEEALQGRKRKKQCQ